MRGSLPLLAGVALAGGCRWVLGIDEASVGDAAVADLDAPIDVSIDALSCLGATPFDLCVDSSRFAPRAYTSATVINTDDDAQCPIVRGFPGSTWCVLPATELTISGTLSAIGSRPLVLLATGTLTISSTGAVDVSSGRAFVGVSRMGAGALPGGSCPPVQPASSNNNGAGGGAGGSFGRRGGDGGFGGMGIVPGATADVNLTAGAQLLGGCPGNPGGDGVGGTGKAEPGLGGGAVYLLAGTELRIVGTVNASGSGGAAGQVRDGGGGAGAGGLIVLWSPQLAVSPDAQIFANGGGGGGGSSALTVGSAGAESTTATLAAAGGVSGGAGSGNGGSGSLGATDGVSGRDDSSASGGGGGGGGGAGLIRIISGQALAGSNISPPSSP